MLSFPLIYDPSVHSVEAICSTQRRKYDDEKCVCKIVGRSRNWIWSGFRAEM